MRMIPFRLVQDELTDPMIIRVIGNEPIDQHDDSRQRAGAELHAKLWINRGLTDIAIRLMVGWHQSWDAVRPPVDEPRVRHEWQVGF